MIAILILTFLLFAAALPILIYRKVLHKGKSTNGVAQYTLSEQERSKFADFFVSRDEKYISSLGNSYIMNYLANRSLSKGFAIISNKRVYFRGSCFSGQGRNLVKTNEERTVDIKDITGSGFIYKRYIGILLGLITAFFVLLCPTILFGFHLLALLEYSMQRVETFTFLQLAYLFFNSAISGVCLSFTITCILIFLNYLKKRTTLFQIQYAGGYIAFDVSYYAKAEIDDFQKQLRRTKDLAEESASKIAVTESPVQPTAQNSVPDDLRKYAELLKEGLISQEEYDAMKKKILNL